MFHFYSNMLNLYIKFTFKCMFYVNVNIHIHGNGCISSTMLYNFIEEKKRIQLTRDTFIVFFRFGFKFKIILLYIWIVANKTIPSAPWSRSKRVDPSVVKRGCEMIS